ncbi:MAG: hypothetical protein ACLP2J_09710 [Acidimicrobiales bacterium]
MSDVAQGPNWWIASDGKWYPPDLHPSVRAQVPATAPVGASASAGGRPGEQQAHVGPPVPDLVQAALQGSSNADNVQVIETGDDRHRQGPARGYGDTFMVGPSADASKKKRRRGR